VTLIILNRLAPRAALEVAKPALKLWAPNSFGLRPSLARVVFDDPANRLGCKPLIGEVIAPANPPEYRSGRDDGRVETLTQGRYRTGDRAATHGDGCSDAFLVRFALADSDTKPLGSCFGIFALLEPPQSRSLAVFGLFGGLGWVIAGLARD
jgi:hypothetical protein